MWLHRDWVKGQLTSAERGTTPILQRLQAVVMLFLAYPIGVSFLKVHEGFIPFHAPRELSIAMKEMQEMGRISDGQRRLPRKEKCLLKENFLEMLCGCCWSPGEMLDLFDNSHLPLRLHVYTRLGTREGNNTLPKDLWLSALSPGPNGAIAADKQIGSALPKELRAVWLFPVFFPLYFPFCSLNFPFPQEVSGT